MQWNLDRVKNLSEELAKNLVEGYYCYDNKVVTTVDLGKKLYDCNVKVHKEKSPVLLDENYSKSWGSYIGIFTSNGLGYTTKKNNDLIFHLTPIAKQFKNNEISYNDLVIKVLSRTQFPKPNGPYNKISNGEYDKPFIKILKILYILYQNSANSAWIDSYDIVEILEKIDFECNYVELCNKILNSRIEKLDRHISDNRDILMNKCIETGLIIKDDNRKYYLDTCKLDKVRDIIIDNEDERFYGDSIDWYEYLGGKL